MISAQRAAELLSANSATARKVFDAVPISDAWSTNAIASELVRTGCNLNYTVIAGCLRSLCNSGLVREAPASMFRRAPVRPAAEPKPEVPKVNMVSTSAAPSPAPASADPLDLLAGLADRARGLAAEVGLLASDIERAALTLAEARTADAARFQKLEQLANLLKGL